MALSRPAISRRSVALAAAGALLLAGCKPDGSSGVNNAADSSGATSGAKSSTSTSAAAKIGQPITIEGNSDGAKITVTALKVARAKATDGFSTPDAGNRYVAVQFKVVNSGTASYEDAPSNGAKVADAQSQQFDAEIPFKNSAGPTLPASVKLSAGGTAVGYVLFQIPKTAKVAKVQFGTDSGFGETAEWTV